MASSVVGLIAVGGPVAGPVAQRGPQRTASVGHTPTADGPGGIVEPPRGLGVVFGGQEVQLCFHT